MDAFAIALILLSLIVILMVGVLIGISLTILRILREAFRIIGRIFDVLH